MTPPTQQNEITINGKTFKLMVLGAGLCQCPECMAKAQAAYNAMKSAGQTLPVKPPLKRWLFGLVREIDIAATPPRWFGRAWHRPEQLDAVVAIIPLNWLLGKLRNAWHALRRGPQQRDLKLIDDVATGLASTVGKASGDLAAYVERDKLRRRIYEEYGNPN